MLHILVIVKVVTDVCGEHVKFKVNNVQCISEPLTTATNLSFKHSNLNLHYFLWSLQNNVMRPIKTILV